MFHRTDDDNNWKWQGQEELYYQESFFGGNHNCYADGLVDMIKSDPPGDSLEELLGVINDPCGQSSGCGEYVHCPPRVATWAGAAVAAEGSESVVANSSTINYNSMQRTFGEKDVTKVAKAPRELEKIAKESTIKTCRPNLNKKIKKNINGNKENIRRSSEITEGNKPDYIHLRARRGQATDSHSLAERARREKISERMRSLQDLVPGCNKITGKASMLDEIINYVQSLQRQVEFLSMKIASVDPTLDSNIDDSFAHGGTILDDCAAGNAALDMANATPDYDQSESVQPCIAPHSKLGVNIYPDIGLRRTLATSYFSVI